MIGMSTKKRFTEEDRIKVVADYIRSPSIGIAWEKRREKAAKKSGITVGTLEKWCKKYHPGLREKWKEEARVERKAERERLAGDEFEVLSCPHCGNEEEDSFGIYEYSTHRHFLRFEDGVVWASGHYDSEGGANYGPEHLFCEACSKEVELADEVVIDYD